MGSTIAKSHFMAFKPDNNVATTIAPNEQADNILSAAFSREVHMQMEKAVDDAITGITRSRAFFREDDISKRVWKMAEKVFPHNVIENDHFEALIQHYVQIRPFVLIGDTGNITTPEMVELEKNMIARAGLENGQHLIRETLVREAIARKKGISEEQIRAVEAACLSPRRVTVIEGTAGAGKSFTMEAVKEAYAESGYTIMGAALSWNAAQVLGESIKLDTCMAIEKLVQGLREARLAGTDFFRRPTLLIIDEAGMVGTQHMATILEETALSSNKVKVVLTGDSLQVNPVDAGNALEAIVAYHGTTRIDTIRRQKQDSHRRAVKRFSMRESGKALYPFLHQEAIHWCRDENTVFNMVVQNFVSYRHANPKKSALVLALRNKDVVELNQRIRGIYKRLGLVDAYEVSVEVTDGRENWFSGFSVGDEVVLRATGKEMIVYDIDPSAPLDDETTWQPNRKGVYNRNAGKIVSIRRSKDPVGSYDFVVDLGGDKPGRVIVNSQKYKHPSKGKLPMVHNFATTIYGSQGQTVDKVFMLDSPMIEFRLAYVGMSRHREHVEVYLNETELHNRMDRMLGRVTPLGTKEEKPGPGEPPKPLEVDLGRYRRSEMLQTVAKSWGKQSQNLTAMMFERRKRLGLDRVNKVEEEQKSIIRCEDGEDNLDFIEEINVRVPQVDIEAIMRLPEPIVEAELVRPSEVKIHNDRIRNNEMPLRQRHDPHAPIAVPSDEKSSVFKKAVSWLLGDPLAPAAPAREATPSARIFDAEAAFDGVPAPVSAGSFSGPKHTILDKVLGRGAKIEVPLLDEPPPVGRIEGDVLIFEGVPQTPAPVDQPVQTVSDAFLKAAKEHYWAIGRNKEPRILARDGSGAVAARYRLDGACVVGEGYPPMMLNSQPTEETPIYIVPGAREWFLMSEMLRQKYASEPSKVPHLIWAAQDVDWGMIAGDMRGQKVVIVRSKHDPSQADWASSLANILKEGWGVEASIAPRIEPQVQPSTASRRSP